MKIKITAIKNKNYKKCINNIDRKYLIKNQDHQQIISHMFTVFNIKKSN